MVLLPSLVYSNSTVAMERFIPEQNSLEDKKIVFWGLVQFHLLIILITWVLLILLNYFVIKWEPWINKIIVRDLNFKDVIILVLARHMASVIGSNCARCALGFKQIKLTQIAVSTKSLLDLLIVFINYLSFDNTQDFLFYSVFGYLIIELGVMFFWLCWLRGTFNDFKLPNNCLKKVWRKEIKLYSGPTVFINILSSFKEKLPILLLGEIGEYSTAAGVSVINKICSFSSKLYSTVSSTVLPSFINDENGLKSQTLLTNFLPVYFCIIGISLSFCMEYILVIWNFDINYEILTISNLYILIFIVSSTLRSAGIWLDYFGDRTRIIYWSLLRCIVYLTFIFIIDLNAINIIICELLSVFCASLLAFFTDKNFWPNKIYTYTSCIFSLIVSLFIFYN